MTATSTMTASPKAVPGWRWPDFEVVVVDPELCKGCSYCQGSTEGATDRPLVWCSNMRVLDKSSGGHITREDAYRLTTADLVFLSELGV